MFSATNMKNLSDQVVQNKYKHVFVEINEAAKKGKYFIDYHPREDDNLDELESMLRSLEYQFYENKIDESEKSLIIRWQ